MTEFVYLDSVDHDGNETLMLKCEVGDRTHDWNGFAVPLVTAAEFSRLVSALARNDRNSTWGDCTISEGDGALIFRDPEYDSRDVWTVAGMIDGSPAYLLDGWTWCVFNREVFDIERAELIARYSDAPSVYL